MHVSNSFSRMPVNQIFYLAAAPFDLLQLLLLLDFHSAEEEKQNVKDIVSKILFVFEYEPKKGKNQPARSW